MSPAFPSAPAVAHIALVGIGATAVLDLWLLLLKRLGIPGASFALIGRWVGHLPRGRFVHAAIGQAAPLRFELGLGWLTHYLVGIVFAALPVLVAGREWLAQPSYPIALAVGIATVAMRSS